jgi:hypothetical protein
VVSARTFVALLSEPLFSILAARVAGKIGTAQLIGRCRPTSHKERQMLRLIVIAVTFALASGAYAQTNRGAGSSTSAPGHQMQSSTKSTAPGASEYAPGHKMQKAKKSTAPGASEYAPGHQGTTTGSSGSKAKASR